MRTYKWTTSAEFYNDVMDSSEVTAESFDEAYALASKESDDIVMITGSKELV